MAAIDTAALEFRYERVNPFDGSPTPNDEGLWWTGHIEPGDYSRLLKFIAADPERYLDSAGVVLASPGGDLVESLRLAEFLKSTYAQVFVGPAAGRCQSACFFLYVAGVRRESLPGLIGIHRPSVHPQHLMSLSPRAAEDYYKEGVRLARAFLDAQEIPTILIDRVFQRASTEMHWIDHNELADQIGRRPAWFEQYLIARCGLDKEAESRFYHAPDADELEAKVRAVDDCAYKLTLPAARLYLYSLLPPTGAPGQSESPQG